MRVQQKNRESDKKHHKQRIYKFLRIFHRDAPENKLSIAYENYWKSMKEMLKILYTNEQSDIL
jgi:ferritin